MAPARVAHQRDPGLLVVGGAVLLAVDVPPLPRLARDDGLAERRVERVHLLLDRGQEVAPQHLLAAVAGDPLEGRVDVDDGAVGVRHHHHVGRLLQRPGQPLVLGLLAAPLGDVLHGAGRLHHRAGGVERPPARGSGASAPGRLARSPGSRSGPRRRPRRAPGRAGPPGCEPRSCGWTSAEAASMVGGASRGSLKSW